MDFFTLIGLSAFFYFFFYAILLWCCDCNVELAFFEKFGKKLVKLRRKVVWITGASSDLAKMMALRVAEEKGKLILSSTFEKELENLKVLCLKVSPTLTENDILILPFDTADLDVHKSVFEKAVKNFGTLDILIINEDKRQKEAWEETALETDRFLFQSNVFGVISLSRLAVLYFSYKRKGKLAVTSSIAGLIGVPYSGCYTGTKHALHGYYNGLRIEKLCENIQITLLCLGSGELSQERSTDSKNWDNGNTTKRLKRKMSVERCADLCLSAIVNNLDEAWMAVFPILFLVYGMKYYPNITKYLLKYLKPNK